MAEQMVTRSTRIHLNGAPDVVFPLFTPVGEYKWIPGWKPTLIYPASGEAMTNNIFATRHGEHDQTIWVTLDYDPPAYHAEYVNVTPGLTTLRLDIRCRTAADGSTEALVTRRVTAIAEAGYAEVAHFSEAAFAEMMRQWQLAIDYYLEHDAVIPQG